LAGAGALGAAGLAAGTVISHPWSGLTSSATHAAVDGDGILVLVTMYGGNDGLNTVIPYTDSAYHSARPNLGYQPDQVLPLEDGLGLHPALTGVKSLWDSGRLAIVRGVSYPNPSLSHFQSMDIWQTASPTDDVGTGWVGRWLDATAGQDPMRAVSIGAALPPALQGADTAAAALTSTSIRLPGGPSFQRLYSVLGRPGPDRPGLAGQTASTCTDLLRVRSELDDLHMPPAAAAATKGAGTFASQMDMVAQLIKAGAPGRVYQASLSSFDTHGEEKTDQARMLTELNAGVSSFFTALDGAPQASKVVLMTYSEFGRRVIENASGGTDHGTAAPLFVAGQGVKGKRFYGEQPSLNHLDPNGNLVYNVDFRSVYATMLEHVIGVDAKSFLGGSFPTLSLL
jgi:uncharacterized protein (DUF1501 family)